MSNPSFHIILDHPNKPFYSPGEKISGQVIAASDTPKDLKYISITFEGYAYVYWSESRTETIGTGKERRTDLRSTENGSIDLPYGTNSFPFHFILPPNLPSSYSSQDGDVIYRMEARMKRAWYKADDTCLLPFKVRGVLDLNLLPQNLTQTQCLEKYKNVCCLCCSSGPVGYNIRLFSTGFVPGEVVPFKAAFINHSNRRVKKVTFALMSRVICYAEGSKRSHGWVIHSVSSGPIEPGDSDSWGGEVLRIPEVPPTGLAGCKIIDVQYYLKFELHLGRCSRNMTAEFPIVIGTVPLKKFAPKGDPVPETSTPSIWT